MPENPSIRIWDDMIKQGVDKKHVYMQAVNHFEDLQKLKASPEVDKAIRQVGAYKRKLVAELDQEEHEAKETRQ